MKTARICVNEGLSVLAELQLPHTPFTKNLRSQYLKSFTQALPKFDHAPSKVQGRANWKKHHKKRLSCVLGLAGPGVPLIQHFGQRFQAWPTALGVFQGNGFLFVDLGASKGKNPFNVSC